MRLTRWILDVSIGLIAFVMESKALYWVVSFLTPSIKFIVFSLARVTPLMMEMMTKERQMKKPTSQRAKFR